MRHQAASSNRLYLLALLNGELLALSASQPMSEFAMAGQVFVIGEESFLETRTGTHVLRKRGMAGRNSQDIRRLELSVQVRNERAFTSIKIWGFEIEGLQKKRAI